MELGNRIRANTQGSYDAERDAVLYTVEGVGYEAPPPKLATIVTAMYDIESNSQHSKKEYQEWMHNFLVCTDPMIIFVDPESSWLEFVQSRRAHAPTIIAHLSLASLVMATSFANEFWTNEVLPLDTHAAEHGNSIDVYKIRNEKMILMHEAAEYNPFETEHFFWYDAAYFRNEQWNPKQSPAVRNNITAQGIPAEQGLFLNIMRDGNYRIDTGSWGGHVKAIPLIYERYFQTFWHMAKVKTPCIGYEQDIMTLMCKSFPDVCAIYDGGKDPHVFGQNWFKSKAMVWDQEHRLSIRVDGDDPVGLPVILPEAAVITSSEQTRRHLR